jgi:tRNA threonylcarbamoyladenosine biosynthesis protein TsaE
MSSVRETITLLPDETFALGERLGEELSGGEIILMTGGLGAGKTLLTKGILNATGFDVDEVTSPSFTLVNLYKTQRFDVYHIDLWRSEGNTAAFAVGLDEILEDETSVVIVEWAERLGHVDFGDRPVYRIEIDGDGDDPRRIAIRRTEQTPAANV